MEYLPFGTNVVVEPTEKGESLTDSGLEGTKMKKGAIDRPTFGIVIAHGPDCQRVKVGMQVYFDKYKMAEIRTPSDELLGSIDEEFIGGEVK